MLGFISQISKYIIVLLMAIYTFQCFYVFRHASEEKRKGTYILQNIFMFLLLFLAFAVICVHTQEREILIFFGAQQIILLAILVLYRIIYPGANRLIVNNMCMLLSISFIMLTRLSFDRSVKQFKIVILSVMLTIFIPFFISKWKWFRKLTWVYGGLGIAALSVVMLLGSITNGSKLFYTIAGYTFQPSEFVKIIFVFFVAGMLSKSTDLLQVLLTSIVASVHILILVASKDLGSALIFSVTYIMMLYVASRNFFYLLGGIAAGVGASVLGYILFAHVRTRIIAWKDPFSVIENQGYQITQSLFAIGTGGWFGMGLYEGAPNKIPVVEADFIFSAISEELGCFFSLCLILICTSCFVMFMNIAMQIRNSFYQLVALGLGIVYGFQVFLTIGGVIKFIPLTGVTLPLVSYGGTSVLTTFIMFAIIQGLYIMRKNEG